MRVSKEQAAKNRERVVDVAARLFRERGFDGVSIETVMAEAGLTHGGFHKAFGSKEDLVEEACRKAVAQSMEDRAVMISQSPRPLERRRLCRFCRDRAGRGSRQRVRREAQYRPGLRDRLPRRR